MIAAARPFPDYAPTPILLATTDDLHAHEDYRDEEKNISEASFQFFAGLVSQIFGGPRDGGSAARALVAITRTTDAEYHLGRHNLAKQIFQAAKEIHPFVQKEDFLIKWGARTGEHRGQYRVLEAPRQSLGIPRWNTGPSKWRTPFGAEYGGLSHSDALENLDDRRSSIDQTALLAALFAGVQAGLLSVYTSESANASSTLAGVSIILCSCSAVASAWASARCIFLKQFLRRYPEQEWVYRVTSDNMQAVKALTNFNWYLLFVSLILTIVGLALFMSQHLSPRRVRPTPGAPPHLVRASASSNDMSAMHNLKRAFEKLPARLDAAKETLAYRHDEAFEKEMDAIRTEIAEGHRFKSFGAERDGNDVKWHIDGHDAFWAMSELIEGATETIMILDWWLTPELFLRRPPSQHPEYRLDRLLLKKAQEGVKIFIIVYKEVTQTMTMSSAHTKHHLEDMHENIAVMRHPDHLGGEVTLYWSHHEKVVLVDNIYACIGGLDLCFGRWDTHTFPLADVHPTDFARSLFAGQDYNNARVRLETARMPWHDVHMTLVGPVVMDIAQHYVERWNFVRSLKYKHDPRYEHLAFPHVVGETDDPIQSIVRHPHLHKWKELGKAYTLHALGQDEGGRVPHGGLGPKGNMHVQCLRSSADWSSGILTEHSIQNAYIQMISEANHFIYIENQFFITNTRPDDGPIKNLIGKAIVQRVLSAARSGKKFKVVIVIPAIPGFSGDLFGNSGTLAIMGATYASICRGPHSIMGTIEAEGFNPHDYVSVYNLRSYDRINNDPARLKRMAEKAGVDFDHAQAALARVFLGPDAWEKELEVNKEVIFTLGTEGGEALNLSTESDSKVSQKKKEAPKTIAIPLPLSYQEAWETIHKFEKGDEVDEAISDSVGHHALQGTGSLLDEKWSGSEDDERLAYVTEELYIHTKLMIVDDRRVICGSANLNDRSQNGDHDSEIALVVEDSDQLASEMNGAPYMATRFAATLRRQLWREHLGLITPQSCPHTGEEPVTAAMTPVGQPQDDVTASEEDRKVMDPLSDATEALWKGTAESNAQIFADVFHCVPAKGILDWASYKAFVPQAPMKPGHVARPDMPVSFIKESLDKVRGHLVTMPLDFLEKETLLAMDASVNPVTLHLAAIPDPVGKDDHYVHNNNVTSSYNAVHAAAALGIKRFVYASSVNAIGLAFSQAPPQFDYFPIDEEHPRYPSDAYALAKAESEIQFDCMVRIHPEMRIASLRIHEVAPLADVKKEHDDDSANARAQL
ncbi:hypothetical protein RQP46_004330 [Phenoliferia psychrophenolica]